MASMKRSSSSQRLPTNPTRGWLQRVMLARFCRLYQIKAGKRPLLRKRATRAMSSSLMRDGTITWAG
jgi:hypothetical protein